MEALAVEGAKGPSLGVWSLRPSARSAAAVRSLPAVGSLSRCPSRCIALDAGSTVPRLSLISLCTMEALAVEGAKGPSLGLEHGGLPVTRRSAKDLFAFESSAFRSPSAVEGV
jgi:hypothetical protein